MTWLRATVGGGVIPIEGGGTPTQPPGLFEPDFSPRVRTETTTSLAGQWTDAPWLIAQRVSKGAGTRIGSGTFESIYGKINDPTIARQVVTAQDRTPKVGTLLRIALTQADGENTTPWHGIVDVAERDPDRRQCIVKANEIHHPLTKAYVWRGWELNAGGFAMANCGTCPDANAWPGGDRSPTKWQSSHYVFARGVAGRAPWMMSELAELLLHRAAWGDLDPAGLGSEGDAIRYRLGDIPLGADYELTRTKIGKRPVWDILTELAGHRRSLMWRPRVEDAVCYLDLVDTDTFGNDYDIAGDVRIEDPKVDVGDRGSDALVMTAGKGQCTVTLAWSPADAAGSSIEPDGWTPGASADADVVAGLSEGDDATYDKPAWRRWRIKPAWDGLSSGSPSTGVRSIGDDAGTRTWNADGPSMAAVELLKTTTLAHDWGSSAEGPRQPACVVAGRTGSWKDLSASHPLSPAGGTDKPPTLTLGTTAADADLLRTLIGTGGTLYVTVAVVEPEPVRVREIRPMADWRIPGLPRIVERTIEGTDRYAAATLVIGVNATETALVRSGSAVQIDSDLPRMREILARAAAWQLATSPTASWTKRGVIDTETKPGDVVKILKITPDESYELNSPFTCITYDLTAKGLGTTYEISQATAPTTLVG